MDTNGFGILLTTFLFTVSIYMFVRGVAHGVRLVLPQSRVMLLTFNNRNSARDAHNLWLVVASAFQMIVRYDGKRQLAILNDVKLAIQLKEGIEEVGFNEISVVLSVSSATLAFFEAGNRRPIVTVLETFYSMLSGLLLEPEWGPYLFPDLFPGIEEAGGEGAENEEEERVRIGKNALEDRLERELSVYAKTVGVTIEKINLGDVNPPESIIEATNRRIQSNVEVVNYTQEKAAEQEDYIRKQLLDTLKGLPLRAIGGDLLTTVVAGVEAARDEEYQGLGGGENVTIAGF